jgi:hypothetical protein
MRLTMPWSAPETHHNGNGYSTKIDELRAALGKEVDHLAKVASQLSQEIGAKASAATSEAAAQAATTATDVARDAQANTGSIVRQLAEGAAALGPTIALMGRKRAETLGHDVQTLGQDLRRVRVTTEPRRTGPDTMAGIALLGGFGAGIALMYFLDPDRGRRRRAMLRDQFNKWTRVGREAASGKAKDLRNRATGAVIEARKAVVPIEPEPETQLFETYAYGSTQTPESPENAEQETRATVG